MPGGPDGPGILQGLILPNHLRLTEALGFEFPASDRTCRGSASGKPPALVTIVRGRLVDVGEVSNLVAEESAFERDHGFAHASFRQARKMPGWLDCRGLNYKLGPGA